MAASCEGTPKMVRLLLDYGGDPSLKDNHQRTAVDYSLQNQSESYEITFHFFHFSLCFTSWKEHTYPGVFNFEPN